MLSSGDKALIDQTNPSHKHFHTRFIDMDATTEQLKALFPIPEPDFPSVVVRNPTRYPGWTIESTKALLDCMRDNHRRFHIFFAGKIFHKCALVFPLSKLALTLCVLPSHSTHHLLTLWTMGTGPVLLKAAYETHAVYLDPAFQPPVRGDVENQPSKGIINEANWKEHLGDERYVSRPRLTFRTAAHPCSVTTRHTSPSLPVC